MLELQETGIRRVKNCSLDYGRWVECPFQGLANSTTLLIQILLVTLIWILFFTLMRIRIRIPASKWRLKTLKKYSNMLIFHTFWLVICKLMWFRIRIKLKTLMRIRIRILPFYLKRIQAVPDPNPQHCFQSSKPLMSLGSRMTLLVCELPSYL